MTTEPEFLKIDPPCEWKDGYDNVYQIIGIRLRNGTWELGNVEFVTPEGIHSRTETRHTISLKAIYDYQIWDNEIALRKSQKDMRDHYTDGALF